MERRKDLTKRLIAENFKELVKRSPFEKLTIKMISDEAGIIRPTFYNYFRDKYDVVEWIFCEDILSEIEKRLDEGKFFDALNYLFTEMDADREYYRKVFSLTGQNGFEEIMESHMYELFLKQTKARTDKGLPDNPVLTPERIARHLSLSMISYLKEWIVDDFKGVTPTQFTEAFIYLSTHPLYQFAQDVEHTESSI